MQRKRTSRPITPKLASRQELQEFLSGLAGARKATAKSTKLEQDQATLRYLARFKRSKLNELMGRAFVDALKSPSQKLGTAPTKTPTRPKKRDTSNRRRGSHFEKG